MQNVGSESIRSARLAEEESDEGTADCEGPNKEAMAVKENSRRYRRFGFGREEVEQDVWR